MQWVSKEPPIYVWGGDTWYNERDKCVYTADLKRQIWHHFKSDEDSSPQIIPFPKKNKGYWLWTHMKEFPFF